MFFSFSYGSSNRINDNRSESSGEDNSRTCSSDNGSSALSVQRVVLLERSDATPQDDILPRFLLNHESPFGHSRRIHPPSSLQCAGHKPFHCSTEPVWTMICFDKRRRSVLIARDSSWMIRTMVPGFPRTPLDLKELNDQVVV